LSAMAWLVAQPVLAVVFVTLTGTLGAIGVWKYHQSSKS
jgi:hypothetical protein